VQNTVIRGRILDFPRLLWNLRAGLWENPPYFAERDTSGFLFPLNPCPANQHAANGRSHRFRRT